MRASDGRRATTIWTNWTTDLAIADDDLDWIRSPAASRCSCSKGLRSNGVADLLSLLFRFFSPARSPGFTNQRRNDADR
nr:hypothetical protein CFP56_60591 [Quercus suber]